MTHRRPPPATAAQQAAQLAEMATVLRDALPLPLLRAIGALVRNPACNSDTLLITADALREAARHDPWHASATALIRLADHLAHLAPARSASPPAASATYDDDDMPAF